MILVVIWVLSPIRHKDIIIIWTIGPLTRYVKLRVAHAPGMPGTFSPQLRVSDPDMHHSTCVTHVSWYMPGSLTSGFLWSRWWGKRSRHSRRMRNPQFYVSGKRPMLSYCWLDNSKQILVMCESRYHHFHARNWMWCENVVCKLVAILVLMCAFKRGARSLCSITTICSPIQYKDVV